MENLQPLGWNHTFAQNFEPYRQAGYQAARVVVEHRGQYLILTPTGEYPAEVTGRLLYTADTPSALPKVGDWVVITFFEAEQKAIIHHILPRQTKLSRQLPGKRVEEQLLAANLDNIFVVQGADADFNLRRLERYLLMVRAGGAEPLIVLNKIDLCQDLPEKILQIRVVAADTPIFTVSGTTGQGVEVMRDYLKSGVTYALVGSSGVGKSTLLNALLGAELQKTAAVRESDSRGRHTTTHRELVKLPGGALLIDSPGIREIQLWPGEVGLEDAFQDITELEAACHFADCTHTQETGCAVQAALADGSLSQARYKNYLKLNREVHYLEQKQSQAALLEAKRKVKELHRNIKLYHKNFDIKR